jgi:hypothetical protein
MFKYQIIIIIVGDKMVEGTDGRIFKIADEGNTRVSNITYNASNITYQGSRAEMSWPDGRILPVYSMGAGSEGRYFGEAGGSGKSMIHQYGDGVEGK